MTAVRGAVAHAMELHGFGHRGLALALVVGALPLLLIVDVLLLIAHSAYEWWVLSHQTAQCPGCRDQVELTGDFACSYCRLVSPRTHAFASCEHCGCREYGVACACGALVRNPLWRPEEM